jgi:beta-lactam-binding protein with PASTA domain
VTGPGTNIWDASGNYVWSMDGKTGFSWDGYEPTSLAVAQADLAAFGVNVGAITYVNDPLVPVGYVITGYVPFLSSAYAGQYIPLVVSGGPPNPGRTYHVPNVVGEYYYDAQLNILDGGFWIALPVFVLSATVLPGYVISQSIPANTTTQVLQQIVITVAGFPVTNQPGTIVPVP